MLASLLVHYYERYIKLKLTRDFTRLYYNQNYKLR